jgi:thioredoxin reductase (NADPH)
MEYDVIVIGRSPAGIQTAIVTSKAGLSTLAIGKNIEDGQAMSDVDDCFRAVRRISETELCNEGESQACVNGTEFIRDEVVSIGYADKGFFVSTPHNKYESQAVLLVAGASKHEVDIEGLMGYNGKGVSYCAACDGFFFSECKVGVLGYTDFAAHEAFELLAVTDDITIFTNGNEESFGKVYGQRIAESTIKVNTSPICGIINSGGEGALGVFGGLKLANGEDVEIEGLFVAYGVASWTDLARKVGAAISPEGIVHANEDFETNIPGLFAVGDHIFDIGYIAKAVGYGATAANSIIKYLKEKGVK